MYSLEYLIMISFGLAVTTITSQNVEKCEYPVELRNGLVSLSFKTEVNFICNQSLSSLNLIPVKHCVSDRGKWTYCLDDFKSWMKCGYPGFSSNGYIYLGKTMDNELAYTCYDGFHLLGEKVRSCHPNGTWSSHVPKCVKRLKIALAEKRLTDRNQFTCVTLNQSRKHFDFKEKIKFHNIQIFFMNKNDENEVKIYFSNDDGDRHLQMAHGPEKLSSGFQQIEFRPLPGTEVARYLVLSATKSISICEIFLFDANEETACGKPDEPFNGRIKTITSIFVEFECERGYSLHGEKSAFCVKGVWQHPAPLCRHPSTNPAPPTPSTAQTLFIYGLTPTKRITTTGSTGNLPQDKNYDNHDYAKTDKKLSKTTKTSPNKGENESENNQKCVIIAWVLGGSATLTVAICLIWRYRVNVKQFNGRSENENEKQKVANCAEIKDVPAYQNVQTVPVNEVIYAEVYAHRNVNAVSCSSKERVSETEYSYVTTSFIRHVRTKAIFEAHP